VLELSLTMIIMREYVFVLLHCVQCVAFSA